MIVVSYCQEKFDLFFFVALGIYFAGHDFVVDREVRTDKQLT